MFRLTDKIALVTRAGSGIGEAIARLFAAQGAIVVIADVHHAAASRVVGEVERQGQRAEALACKLSGSVTEAESAQGQLEDVAPFVMHALTVFGPERGLFSSDWPVLETTATYAQWVQTFDNLTHSLAVEHRRLLWRDNARRWYQLAGL